MFPSLTADLLEQVNNIESSSSTNVSTLGRCFKFDFNANEFVQVDGKLVEMTSKAESVEQWILLILHTPKDKYNVYKDTDFYCNIQDLTGGKLDAYKRAEIERELEEAIKKHRYVKSITNANIEQDKRKVTISLMVKLIDDSDVEVSTSV
jgi:hypothetical protein